MYLTHLDTTAIPSTKIKTIGDCLLDIIEQRKRMSKSTYFRPTRQDYAKGEMWVSGMSESDKNRCWSYLEPKTSYSEQEFIQRLWAYHLPEPDYLPPHTINTPIEQLLKWYSDKTSKHVCAARKELIMRYAFLDETDQSAFRLALISSSTKADQIQGLNYFLELPHLTSKDLNAVKELWSRTETKNVADVWYAACKLLIRHSDTDFLLKHKRHLCETGEEKTNPRLYYYLCVKLVKTPGFKLRKEKLNIEDYYRLVAYHSLYFDVEEWKKDFYRVVADIYAAGTFPCQVSVRIKDREQWGDQEQRWMSILEIDHIRHMLQYAAQMDFAGAIAEITYCHLVDVAVEIGERQPDVLYDFCPESYQNLFKMNKN